VEADDAAVEVEASFSRRLLLPLSRWWLVKLAARLSKLPPPPLPGDATIVGLIASAFA
jgi:hypothetical protein